MSTNSAPWDRTLDQWKVTELKDELKRRKLITRGLKEELVRRLHEALRKEAAEATDMGNGFNLQDEPLVGSKDVEVNDEGHVKPKDGGEPLVKDVKNKNVDMVDVNDSCVSVAQDDRVGNLSDNKLPDSDNKREDETAGLTDCGLGADKDPASEISNPSVDAKIEASIPGDVKPIDSTAISQVSENMPDCKDFSAAEPKDEAPITEESQTASEPIPQVSESVHQVVKCESVSTDSVSIKQENTLKDNLITDNVPVEPEIVKKEVPQSLSSNDAGDHGASVTDVEGGVDSAAKCGEVTHDMDVDSFEKGDADTYAHESVVKEPVQEVTESKSSDITLDHDGGNKDIKIQESIAIEEKIESETTTAQINMEEKYEFVESIEHSTQLAEKRKAGTDVVVEHEPPKRQRKWNSDHELAKVSAARPPRLDKENFPDATQTSPLAASNANLLSPRDKAQGVKLARTDSNIDSEAPKERIVPPPQRSPTTSLRIDKFLRPFTLKAVQEFLAKTGTIRSFWMDHIKTHCYVMYSSVDEAVATRDALYNLQWPPNGGRLLTAEFVEPEDVKLRVEGGPQSPSAVSQPTVPPPQSNQVNPHASMRLPLPPVVPPSSNQQLPPPPPLTPQARPQHVGCDRLPPPPPPKKIEAPVLTLDDLFKKTRGTPRIYYLPLSEEQVAAKLASTGADGCDKAALTLFTC